MHFSNVTTVILEARTEAHQKPSKPGQKHYNVYKALLLESLGRPTESHSTPGIVRFRQLPADKLEDLHFGFVVLLRAVAKVPALPGQDTVEKSCR